MSRLESVQNLFVGLFDKSQDKPISSTAEPSAMSKLFPKDNEWLDNLHQKANPNFDNPTEKTDESFWVKLPPKRDARTIRENLLRDNFGFEKADVIAYDKETKNKGLFVSDSGKPDKWATSGEIGKWNIRGGYVEISLSKEKAAELRNFRVSRVIDKSLQGIGDTFLRAAVKKDLMWATAGEGLNRTQAADRLLNLAVENPVDAETIRSAIRTVAKQPENQNNAVVQIVSAKVDLADITREMSKGNSQDAEKLRQKIFDYQSNVEKTARLAGGFNKLSDAQMPNSKINREEAVWANWQAAGIYGQLGDEKKAAERVMLARYYQVDDKERNSIEFKFGRAPDLGLSIVKVIPRLREGEFSISAPTGKTPRSEPPTAPTKKDLSEDPYKLELRKYKKTYEIVETTWRDGKPPTTRTQKGEPVIETVRDFQMEGSLKVEGKTTKETTISNKERRVERRTSYIETETLSSSELNSTGRNNASVAAGYAAMPEEWNKWMNFRIQGDIATKEIAAMDKAKRKAFIKNNYPLPPEPKDLPKVKFELETHLGKEKAKEVMKFIEEASYAVWGRKR
jgi:hypothetical protein